MIFQMEKWQLASKGVVPTVIADIRQAALAIASVLPPQPSVDQIPSAQEPLGELREQLAQARLTSQQAGLLPPEDCLDAQLAIWALGLAHNACLTRGS